MITKLRRNVDGVTEFAISDISELESIDVNDIAPTSSVILINETGRWVFTLTADSKWLPPPPSKE